MTRITASVPGFHRLALYDQDGDLVSAQDNTDSRTQTLHVEGHVSSHVRIEKLPTVKRFGWMYDGVHYASKASAEAAALDDVQPHSWEELA